MKTKIYSIFDNKMGTFQLPFYAHNSGHAIRTVTKALRSANSHLADFPEDYVVYEIGEFNDESGGIIAHNQPIHVTNVLDLAQTNVSNLGGQPDAVENS